jgi:molybdopterin molybdotransferase
MDGFAVASSLTSSASPERPVKLRISHIMAAGDSVEYPVGKYPKNYAYSSSDRASREECVEIMTGARFPDATHPECDAVIKIEDVKVFEGMLRHLNGSNHCRYIEVTAPIDKKKNKRFKGSDIARGDIMITEGERVEPKHVMALASLGYGSIRVIRGIDQQKQDMKPACGGSGLRIGVMPTGSELVDKRYGDPEDGLKACEAQKNKVFNSNGPYLLAALQARLKSSTVQHLDIAKDTREDLKLKLAHAVSRMDVVITTGGVSMGKYDLVRSVLEDDFDATIVFHGVKVRPGLPVLCALVHMDNTCDSMPTPKMTAVFGLPGNPLASAMALRFFVVPYLAALGVSMVEEIPACCEVRLQSQATIPRPLDGAINGHIRRKPSHLRVFWLGHWSVGADLKPPTVDILDEQSSYKMRALLAANCWVEVPEGVDRVSDGESLRIYSL